MFKKNNLLWVCIFLQTLIFLSSCKKRNDEIALGDDTVLPSDLIYTDTLTVLASSIDEPGVPTDRLQQFLVGRMNDPILGISQSSIFTQIRLSALSNLINMGSGIDSAILLLNFTSEIANYGKLESSQSLSVFELSNPFNASDAIRYYSYDSILTFPVAIGSYTGTFNVKDSIKVYEGSTFVNKPPGLKINLTKAFAEKLLSAGANDISTQANFKQYLYGICIKPSGNPSSGEGAVAGINLNNTNSRIRVYYDGGKEVDFLIEEGDRKFVKYDFENQPAFLTTQKANPELHYDTTVVQALTGAKTHLRFPTLFNLIADGPILIHRAQIVIPVIKNTITDVYHAPLRLLVNQPDIQNNNMNLGIEDFFVSPMDYDGVYNETKGTYTFGITRHVQKLFNSYVRDQDDFNNGIFITPTLDLPITPARVLIDASRNGLNNTEKLRLIILYSKL